MSSKCRPKLLPLPIEPIEKLNDWQMLVKSANLVHLVIFHIFASCRWMGQTTQTKWNRVWTEHISEKGSFWSISKVDWEPISFFFHQLVKSSLCSVHHNIVFPFYAWCYISGGACIVGILNIDKNLKKKYIYYFLFLNHWEENTFFFQ